MATTTRTIDTLVAALTALRTAFDTLEGLDGCQKHQASIRRTMTDLRDGPLAAVQQAAKQEAKTPAGNPNADTTPTAEQAAEYKALEAAHKPAPQTVDQPKPAPATDLEALLALWTSRKLDLPIGMPMKAATVRKYAVTAFGKEVVDAAMAKPVLPTGGPDGLKPHAAAKARLIAAGKAAGVEVKLSGKTHDLLARATALEEQVKRAAERKAATNAQPKQPVAQPKPAAKPEPKPAAPAKTVQQQLAEAVMGLNDANATGMLALVTGHLAAQARATARFGKVA